ncbi:PRC-barrel domain-containing protein [Nocardioides sp.]|uniref:PRC-barrel domain-containing protein n=1 Tax=Nocardioides sp. TaxID=35761 RepID=UPI002726F3C4|nr:PRC-barrel domain-containing protein [Nocardioides sp.]MDO9456348.1 PRC-barrel domain-containing protein [Nocardioides sp.]
MQWSQLKKHKVVSTATADKVGKVDGFLLDPATRSVVGLTLKKTDSGSVVRWSDLVAVGADAVTVPDAAVVLEPDEAQGALADKRGSVLKKLVLDDDGNALGTVKDIDLDPETGALRELLLDTRTVSGDRLLGVGSYAVVVRAD